MLEPATPAAVTPGEGGARDGAFGPPVPVPVPMPPTDPARKFSHHSLCPVASARAWLIIPLPACPGEGGGGPLDSP